MNIDDVTRNLLKKIEEKGLDVNALVSGSEHPYSCSCKTCWMWWKLMGLGDERNAPFTQMEIDQETYEAALNLFPRGE